MDLPGSNLLQTLSMPCNMTLTQSYEEKRDLLIGKLYKRSNTSVASRAYTYDTLGRPMTRSTSKDGSTVNDSFGYNSRSELNIATVNNEAYAYDYDNIGNRETAQEAAESATTYESNNLNQYTAIGDFEPTYDDAGNQTTVKTTTGIWSVIYNAENRPTSFTNADNGTIVECSYDYMGRRATKKVTVNGTVTLHQRFLYRGYLQIACCDLTLSNHPCLWLLTWDPSEPVATRPLAIQKDGTWYTYGWDLTKNICEVYGQHGCIRTNYSYSPYGEVTISGDVIQPIQWSSEINDEDTSLVYYNYRYFDPQNGKWLSFDPLFPKYTNSYLFAKNNPLIFFDINGLKPSWSKVVNAYDEDVLFDDLVGSISLKIKIDDEAPVNSSRIVFYGRDGDIAYQKHDTIIEEIDNETKVITFSATVSASLVDYGDALMIGGGIAGGATTGAIIGGGIGTLAGGVVSGPGAAAGSIIGGVVGGIGGACYGSDVSVSLLLKAKLTCKCTESQWIPTKIEDFSENARGKAKRNGDLYINVK